MRILRFLIWAAVWLAYLGGGGHPSLLAQVRISCGGPGGTDAAGTVWSPDMGFSGGSAYTDCGTSATPVCPANLTVPFLALRYGKSFTYSFQVTPGYYLVTLGLLEPTYTSVKQRLMSVTVNGTAALTNFDIFAAAGAMTPILEAFPAVVTNGTLTLAFSASKSSAVVSSIQLDNLISGGAFSVPIATLRQYFCTVPYDCQGIQAFQYTLGATVQTWAAIPAWPAFTAVFPAWPSKLIPLQ